MEAKSSCVSHFIAELTVRKDFLLVIIRAITTRELLEGIFNICLNSVIFPSWNVFLDTQGSISVQVLG